MHVPIFSGKGGGYLGGIVLGRFLEKAQKRGCFIILPMVINTQDSVYISPPPPEIGGGGLVQVMGNKNRYPLILLEWGGGMDSDRQQKDI